MPDLSKLDPKGMEAAIKEAATVPIGGYDQLDDLMAVLSVGILSYLQHAEVVGWVPVDKDGRNVGLSKGDAAAICETLTRTAPQYAPFTLVPLVRGAAK